MDIELILVVLVAAVVLGTLLGHRYRVGPPVLLIFLGALLGLVPAFGEVRINGELVLLLFLPAILYWESLNTSLREMRANQRVIIFLSVALVIATAFAVAWTGRALGMDPRAAAVLGAVLSPTDAAAVAGLAKKLPRRTLVVLSGESLINDGTALVLFAVAVQVAVGGEIVGPVQLFGRFLGSYAGGIVAGLVVGVAVTLLRRRIDAPSVEGALSLWTPFAAFLLAEEMSGSGVVAVLVSGLTLAYSGPRVIRARSRLQTYSFWEITTFIINGTLWVFVGVQVPGAVRHLDRAHDGLGHAFVLAFAVTGVIIVSRIFWVEATTLLIRVLDRSGAYVERRSTWRQRLITSWSGFRGAVSLAAALAVPLTTRGGAPFPDRNLIIFVVVVVILVTVLVQGSALPLIVRWARLPADEEYIGELQLARKHSAATAVAALPAIAEQCHVNPRLQARLMEEYQGRAAVIADSEGGPGPTALKQKRVREIRLRVLCEQRSALTQLRNEGLIDDIVLREVQAELDLEEVQLLNSDDEEDTSWTTETEC